MRQYLNLKAEVPDALLLFRMGDFYELFGEDAVTASQLLEITLTSRDKNKENPVPMAGVPHHSAQGYIQKLLKAGRKVAIGEQMEEPSEKVNTKAIVRREIVRILSPAIQFDNEGAKSSYLATALSLHSGTQWTLACLEVSTGECLVSAWLPLSELLLELSALPISHFLFLGDTLPEEIKAALTTPEVLIEPLSPHCLCLTQAEDILKQHYAIQNPESLFSFLETARPTDLEGAILSLALLVSTATQAQKVKTLRHLQHPSPLHRPQSMRLCPRTQQHLDLFPTADGTPNLYDFINHTRSALGARQLKRWILAPLLIPSEIEARQKAIQDLILNSKLTQKISSELSSLYDLERICGRLNAHLANPRDTYAFGKSISILPHLVTLLDPMQSPLLKNLKNEFEKSWNILAPLSQRILKTQQELAPLSSKEGGVFNVGTSAELDHLLFLNENGQRWIIDLEKRERETTGISSLKVRYNRVFGYYIEVTHTQVKNVPDHYQRKQTLVGAERFITEELKKFEEEILTASTRQKALEHCLFEDLLQALHAETASVMEVAQSLSTLDVFCSFTSLAVTPGWVFPEVDHSLELTLELSRHPLVDQISRGSFVPNDLTLSPDSKLLLIITGPNMGGKSTVMRQVALTVILGQMGAPVPAKRAHWGVISSLFTRIGAQDAISRGQSTFMVEMTELAQILHHADSHSLLILDEIGRGTSTYDGISVAWATLEWLAKGIKPRTLFATHYHELTHLEGALPLVANAHMAVEGTRTLQGGNLRFLYQLRKGPTADSFGIYVGQLAGLPQAITDRAWKILEELENKKGKEMGD
jgi:DNA mismatch repair protein MutS